MTADNVDSTAGGAVQRLFGFDQKIAKCSVAILELSTVQMTIQVLSDVRTQTWNLVMGPPNLCRFGKLRSEKVPCNMLRFVKFSCKLKDLKNLSFVETCEARSRVVRREKDKKIESGARRPFDEVWKSVGTLR